ncbi:hypothetical protein NUITMVA1_18610 [Aeromonas hydrophila]|nr:hypothetical protein NUITMVA1_18610 [Aeromonas hydrophila]
MLCIYNRLCLICGVKACGSNGCITNTVNGDKATIATGTGYTTDPATTTTGGRCPTGSRSFKVLCRVYPLQN